LSPLRPAISNFFSRRERGTCRRLAWGETSLKGEFLAVVSPSSAGEKWKTPSPSPFGQRSQPHPQQCQIATKGGNDFAAM
jgi:hypothetical protein